tara:strand:+ start:1991 stop:2578 length:588 start_codon:yes stop_codon:yes gene_type:complete
MKDKLILIEALSNQAMIDEFEAELEKNPLIENDISRLSQAARLSTMDYVKSLRDRGFIKPNPMPTMAEFEKANPNAVFTIRESAVAQMTTTQFREFRRSGLLQSDKVAIYPDIEPGQSVVHYNYYNKNGTTHSTGANETMIRVVFKDLDEKESEANYQLVVEADKYYDFAKSQIESLLMNLEPIKNGTFNSNYAF